MSMPCNCHASAMLILLDPNQGEQAAEDVASSLAEEAATAPTAEEVSDFKEAEDRAESRAAIEAEEAEDAAEAEHVRVHGLQCMDANMCEADCLRALSD